MQLVSAGCDTHPTVTKIEAPTGMAADVWVRGRHLGANVWIFTLHATEAAALAGEEAAGVAGSETMEGSGLWPVSENPPYPPNTTGWILHAAKPETPPAGECVDVWRWTTKMGSVLCDAACSVLAEYTGEGQSLDGFMIHCGDPGKQYPTPCVVVTITDATPAVGSAMSTARRFMLTAEVRMDGVDAEATWKLAQGAWGAVSEILSSRVSDLPATEISVQGADGAAPAQGIAAEAATVSASVLVHGIVREG